MTDTSTRPEGIVVSPTDDLKKLKIKPVYECIHCNKMYKSERAFIKHIKIVHKLPYRRLDANRYVCAQCNSTFGHLDSLKMHFKKHATKESELYKCRMPGCDKVFVQRSYRNDHEMFEHFTNKKNNHGITVYKCDECEMVAISKDYFKYHLQYNHVFDPPKKCDSCKYTFKNKISYNIHKTLIHAEKGDPCETPTEEKRHEREREAIKEKEHTEKEEHAQKEEPTLKIHECEECNRTFTDERDFEKHLKVHVTRLKKTNKKLFLCRDFECDKAFVSHVNRDYHELFHHFIKKHQDHDKVYYECGRCRKHFASKEQIKNHITSTHTLRTAIRCNKCGCGRSFKNEIRYDMHKWMYHSQ